jgi:hypothetical protein
MDYIPLSSKSIGGNTVILLAKDDYSKFLIAVPAVSKQEAKTREAALGIVYTCNSYGHRVERMLTDDEKSLATLKPHLAKLGIRVSATPAGLHCKSVERDVRTIKGQKAAMFASLAYEPPGKLECEAFMHVIRCGSFVPNSNTGAHSPFQLFTGQKPSIPHIPWGALGFFYSSKKDKGKGANFIMGIFVGFGDSVKYLRCYSPMTDQVYSKRKFVPFPRGHIPPEWKLKLRVRPPDSVVQRLLKEHNMAGAVTPQRVPSRSLSDVNNVNVQTGASETLRPQPLCVDEVDNARSEEAVGRASEGAVVSVAKHGVDVYPSVEDWQHQEGGGLTAATELEGEEQEEEDEEKTVRRRREKPRSRGEEREEVEVTVRKRREKPRPRAVTFGESIGASSSAAAPDEIVTKVSASVNVTAETQKERERGARREAVKKSQPQEKKNVAVGGVATRSQSQAQGQAQGQEKKKAGVEQTETRGEKRKPSQSKVVEASASNTGRVLRSTAGSWRDGPSGKKGGDFVTEKSKKDGGKAFRAELELLNDPRGSVKVTAMRASIKRALADKKRRESVLKAIHAEIDNLEKPNVLKPVHFRDIPEEFRDDIIGAYMFHVEKFKADGTFDKDKCRIVLLSNLRNEDSIGETFSPTVNPISVLTQLNLAAVRNQKISAYDIKGAFLLTPMQEGKRMFMRIGEDVSKHWVDRYPERRSFMQRDGAMFFELKSYVYGLHEAPKEFNSLLDGRLQKMGFKPSKADRCLYTMRQGKEWLILSVHVDDMLLTCPSEECQRWFEEEMEQQFELVKQYDEVSYLGMTIKPGKKWVRVDQEGFLRSILKKHGLEGLKKTPSTPATDKLLERGESKAVDKTQYLSLLMSLMYLARYTRPDVLMPVSYLATKSSKPTEDDFGKAMRVLRYLAGTVSVGLEFRRDVKFHPIIHADASHLLYDSGHGQAGMFITNGSAPVAHRSIKIKMITRSSSESELVCLEDASTYAVWYSLLLKEMGVDLGGPITITQDNMSSMVMAVQGATFRRTKHLMGRESYVRERLLNKEVVLQYVPTNDMVADVLTKPMGKGKLERFSKMLFLKTERSSA